MRGDDQTKLDVIYDNVLDYREKGEVIIMGDLNCRVGQETDYIESDDGDRFLNLPAQLDHTNYDDIVDDNSCIIKNRTSADLVINETGRELLQLCRTNKLYILNGRVGTEPEGGFTCHTSRGSSVVDYIIVGNTILPFTGTFNIGEPSPLSDHSSVTASFKYIKCTDVTSEEKQKQFILY